MLIDVDNACYKLLKVLGCDLSAVNEHTTRMQFGVICLQFAFACLMIYFLWKMLYNCMIRFFSPKAW